MKDLITINSSGWYWPKYDKYCWDFQQKEGNMIDNVKPFLKGQDVMVQAGGNCGYVLSKFIGHFNHIYTFEPDPVNFYCLNLNITHPSVIKLQSCVGNSNELVGINNYLEDAGGVHVSGTGYVPCMKIDDLHLTACNLIQLDVEGFEFNALLGAINTIEKYGPVLILEWWEPWATRYKVTSQKLNGLLAAMGYSHAAKSNMDDIYVRN